MTRSRWTTRARALELIVEGGRYSGRMLAFWAVCPTCQSDLGPVSATRIACLDCRTVHGAQRSAVILRSESMARIVEAALRLEALHPALFAGEHEVDLDLTDARAA